MTVQSVVQEVCSVIGVRPPNGSLFQSPYADRTAWEFVNLANEIAQRIAYDTRDWTALKRLWQFGGGTSEPGGDAFPLPADYRRMLLTTNVWRSNNNQRPMSFISDTDEWFQRRFAGNNSVHGEWMLMGDSIFTWPGFDGTQRLVYLDKNCVSLASGGFGNRFLADADTFRLDERLLKLGMIWQWKANKGATYAEDLATYEDALSRIGGNDKPSPVIVGSQPISSDATIAYWGPTPAGGTFVGPPVVPVFP